MARAQAIGTRAVVASMGLGAAVGWNIGNVGPVATRLSQDYGVGLTTIGLYTTALFVTHMAMQIPGGRAADRWGARTSGLVGLSLIALGNAIAVVAPQPALALVGRAVAGIGTGFGFVSGSDYVRAHGGSPLVQGIYGASSVLAPGLALALVPGFESWAGFRAPFLSALIVVGGAALLLLAAPAAPPSVRHAGERLDAGFLRDVGLRRLAIVHAFSFGFSVIAGNWVVTLLEHHGQAKGAAAAAGSLTLLLSAITRPVGGPLLRRGDARLWIAGSMVLGGAGALALAAPLPLPALVAAAAAVGLASGIPFALVFTGAARARPEAPGAAVGFVNGWAALTILVGTPLVGLTFSLPGDGRVGFVILGALGALASLATPRPASP